MKIIQNIQYIEWVYLVVQFSVPLFATEDEKKKKKKAKNKHVTDKKGTFFCLSIMCLFIFLFIYFFRYIQIVE